MEPLIHSEIIVPGMKPKWNLAEISMMMISLLAPCVLLAVVVKNSLQHTLINQEMDAAGMKAVKLTVVFTMTMISKQRETANNVHQKTLQTLAQLVGMMNTTLVTLMVTVAIGTSQTNSPAALSMMMISQLQKPAAHAGTALLTAQLTSAISQEHPKPSLPHFSYKV
jgi:hypothetical protein